MQDSCSDLVSNNLLVDILVNVEQNNFKHALYVALQDLLLFM